MGAKTLQNNANVECFILGKQERVMGCTRINRIFVGFNGNRGKSKTVFEISTK